MPEPTDESMTAKADAAFRQAATRVVRVARQAGTQIIIWDHERGQLRAISPDEALEQLSGIPSPQTPTASDSGRSTRE
jgi:hypothetical protein